MIVNLESFSSITRVRAAVRRVVRGYILPYRGLLLFTSLVAGTVVLLPSQAIAEVLSLAVSVPAYGLATLMALQILSLTLLSGQWLLLLRHDLGVTHARIGGVGFRYVAASAVEALTPSAKLGGEAARLYLFAKRYGCRARDLVRPAARQVTGLLAGFVVFALVAVAFSIGLIGDSSGTLPFGPATSLSTVAAGNAPALIVAGTAIAGLAVFVFLRSMLRRGLLRMPDRTLVRLAVSSGLVWALYPVKVALAAFFLGIEIAVPVVIVATFAAYAVGLLPITPGGLGTYEATMMGVFSAAGVAPANAAAVALLARAVSYWAPLLLSLGAAGLLTLSAEGCASAQQNPMLHNQHVRYQEQMI